mmetsp:Transcript_39900/g.112767  ORF Transcript_39900/g.112767 Transcript_39900/m.112767 type:complete len:224 (+) Transcript_39900:67-738(+)
MEDGARGRGNQAIHEAQPSAKVTSMLHLAAVTGKSPRVRRHRSCLKRVLGSFSAHSVYMLMSARPPRSDDQNYCGPPSRRYLDQGFGLIPSLSASKRPEVSVATKPRARAWTQTCASMSRAFTMVPSSRKQATSAGMKRRPVANCRIPVAACACRSTGSTVTAMNTKTWPFRKNWLIKAGAAPPPTRSSARGAAAKQTRLTVARARARSAEAPLTSRRAQTSE